MAPWLIPMRYIAGYVLPRFEKSRAVKASLRPPVLAASSSF